MVRSPSWEANISSTSQEIPRVSFLHSLAPATCPRPQPEQSISCPPTHILKVNFKMILPSTPWSSQWCPLKSSHQKPVCTSPVLQTSHVPSPSLSLDMITWMIVSEEYRAQRSSLCSLLRSAGIIPLILTSALYGNKVASFRSRPLYPRGQSPVYTKMKLDGIIHGQYCFSISCFCQELVKTLDFVGLK